MCENLQSLFVGLSAVTLSGQNGPKNGNEWRAYASDPGSSKYSPLDQINKDNAKTCGSRGDSRPRTSVRAPITTVQVTPLMVNGVMYAQAGMRRAVVAIEPTTGELLWMWRMDEGKRGEVRRRKGRAEASRTGPTAKATSGSSG